MSNTRRQTTPGPLRQERFASSQEFDTGLKANLVAKRCSVLERAEDRALIWFLQLLSHLDGGLKQLAAQMLERFPDRLATPAMQRFGFKPGQIYNASQVKAVRAELPLQNGEFLLRGERTLIEECGYGESTAHHFRPTDYPADDFAKRCREAAAGLDDFLARLCLDPALPIALGTPWYFPTLAETLRELQAEWIAARQPAAVTSIGKQVCSALDYADESKLLVLIYGPARTGKTESAKAWCKAHPGRARYVQCPSTNDDFSFYRAIAESLGVAINLKSKAQELRSRIEEALRAGDLMLVIDEAHYLWPQSHYRNTMPVRVTWLMTAVVNYEVPVALVTTPQFFRSQRAIEAVTCWTSEQFTGRIGHYEKLPETLTAADLKAVARALLPDGDARSIEALALYAQSSAKYLAGIRWATARAQYIAQHDGRPRVEFRDIKRAIQESVIPSDAAFASAMNSSGAKAPRKRPVSVPAAPLQGDFKPAALEVTPADFPVRGGNLAAHPRAASESLVDA